MDIITTNLSDYWWVAVLPVVLLLFIWIFRGRWLRWAFLFFVAGFVFFYYKGGKALGLGSAFSRFANHVVDVLQQVGASLI